MVPIGRGFSECTTTPIAEPGVRYAYRLDGDLHDPTHARGRNPMGFSRPRRCVIRIDSIGMKERARAGPISACLLRAHVGTFTAEGTFDAVIPRISELLDLGITAIELMPVGQFPGTRGWRLRRGLPVRSPE